MSAIIFERWNSRRMSVGVERSSMEFAYVVTGSDQEDDARALVEATLTPTYTGLDGLQLIFETYELSYIGNLSWDVTAHYSTHFPRGNGSLPFPQETSVYAFELSQQTVKRTQTLRTLHSYGVGGSPGNYQVLPTAAPDCGGTIGCNGDSVEGVDVNVPVFTFSETWWIPKSQITPDYVNAIYSVGIAPVNDAPFRGYDTGQVLFLGASGTERDDANFEITFRFSVGPNVIDQEGPVPAHLTAPDGTTQMPLTYTKNAWDYLWFRYQDVADSNTLVKRPVAAYVEQVYLSGDFSQLGIGT